MNQSTTRRNFLAAALALTAGSADATTRPSGLPALCNVARSFQRRFGSAVSFAGAMNDRDYWRLLLDQCDLFTPEYELQWSNLEPQRGQYRYDAMDSLAGLTQKNGKSMRGHALLWHLGTPGWAERNIRDTRDWSIVKSHIGATLARYNDGVDEWIVVNEPIDVGHRADGLRPNVFLEAFGPDYIRHALEDARAAAPGKRLMINEFSLEYGNQEERDRRYHFIKLIEKLRNADAPLDGVGLQAHLDLRKGMLDRAAYTEFLKQIADFGLYIDITEFDVKERDYGAPAPRRDALVAAAAHEYLELVLTQRAVRSITCWGLSDRHSWLKVEASDYARHPNYWKDGTSPGFNRGLPFDSSLRRKPMYNAILAAFV